MLSMHACSMHTPMQKLSWREARRAASSTKGERQDSPEFSTGSHSCFDFSSWPCLCCYYPLIGWSEGSVRFRCRDLQKNSWENPCNAHRPKKPHGPKAKFGNFGNKSINPYPGNLKYFWSRDVGAVKHVTSLARALKQKCGWNVVRCDHISETSGEWSGNFVCGLTLYLVIMGPRTTCSVMSSMTSSLESHQGSKTQPPTIQVRR